MDIFGLLLFLVVVLVVLWAVQKLLAAFSIGDPIATVVYVFVVIALLGFLLNGFGVGPELGLHQCLRAR